ncbi:heat shock protein 60 family co-chaperone GroES [Vibrio variabilis]|uniref:Co-chaperonin GroES n=1 Tax=Vibrio variabilis TaxID=990271 RepID=A0ABQ0JIS9_9VIBR|nr:heat shock protein 60 family co-chaperone GroES [Vibrio variabilis]
MNIQPLQERVLLRTIQKEAKSDGGIVLTGLSVNKPNRGEVISCGHGYLLADGSRRTLEVKPGQVVLFNPASVQMEEKIDGDSYVLIGEHDIVAVVTE